jgi:hypothetical protein
MIRERRGGCNVMVTMTSAADLGGGLSVHVNRRRLARNLRFSGEASPPGLVT